MVLGSTLVLSFHGCSIRDWLFFESRSWKSEVKVSEGPGSFGTLWDEPFLVSPPVRSLLMTFDLP